MGKLSTPDWVKEGYSSKAEYEKKWHSQVRPNSSESQVKGIKSKKKEGKTFKIKKCPKCESDKIHVMLIGEEGKSAKEWECKKCKWHGREVDEQELTEEQFMKYLDEKGEEVA